MVHLEKGWSGMVCIDPVQERDQWRALVDAEMNFRKILE
jgi:hypothetical protein